MKVLITGQNSYIGRNLLTFLDRHGFQCEAVSVRECMPDFLGYDAVVHAAAIVHVKERYPEEYYTINTRLTQSLADKAKNQGVKQFVFLSSMAVYGEGAYQDSGVIQDDTHISPDSHYGESKAMAEVLLQAMEEDAFKIAVIRIPMVYGLNCTGNFARLKALACMVPVFPYVDNQRSMIHIDNLCEFLRLIILQKERGIYCPQNREYVNTSELVRDIRAAMGKKTVLSPWLGRLVCVIPIRTVRKMFGNLTYAKNMTSYFDNAYCIRDYAESVKYSCNPLI